MHEYNYLAGNNPLYFAETEHEVVHLVEKYGTSSVNMFGDTVLHYVGSKDITRLLIENGADVNLKNRMGMTPLHYAINDDVALELILNGADIESVSSTGLTPLHMAMGIRVSRVLINYGANVNALTDLGETPLHIAPNTSIIDLLVENGADIDAEDFTGTTPLLNQAYCMSVNIFGSDRHVKRLIELGASIDSKNNTGFGIQEIMGDTYPFIEKVQCERSRREMVILRTIYKRKQHEWEEESICNRVITHHSDDIFRRIVEFI